MRLQVDADLHETWWMLMDEGVQVTIDVDKTALQFLHMEDYLLALDILDREEIRHEAVGFYVPAAAV